MSTELMDVDEETLRPVGREPKKSILESPCYSPLAFALDVLNEDNPKHDPFTTFLNREFANELSRHVEYRNRMDNWFNLFGTLNSYDIAFITTSYDGMRMNLSIQSIEELKNNKYTSLPDMMHDLVLVYSEKRTVIIQETQDLFRAFQEKNQDCGDIEIAPSTIALLGSVYENVAADVFYEFPLRNMDLIGINGVLLKE